MRRCAFKPAGASARDLAHVDLGFDELEAIRLADYEGLYQEAAALRMGVSRQTFARIVESGRRKVADAIVNGKCLRIEATEPVLQVKEDKGMKVAVPARDGLVDAHFGHCDHFMVYALAADGTIDSEEKIVPPEGCGCKSDIALTLARMGVTHMVAGNMGEGAVHVLKAHGIGVTRGAAGMARSAAQRFARGELRDSTIPCAGHGHGHGHECHEHGHAHESKGKED
jgi:predicted DNA-binding protein (UPF0251 family)/predicted Fe-Mo cluster-binding NifX family protein